MAAVETASSAKDIPAQGNGASSSRHAYTRTILGPARAQRLASARVLVVGAGGIGCELLKNLVLVGVGHVDIIDLDTIDLSNLNRQFLFQKVHIGKPKSLVATTTAKQFVPHASVTPHHANVKDTQAFGWEYFSSFDAVCNALDNLDARRWVNSMCVQTGTPLVESGTTGFQGQVQPILPGTTECFDCVGKVTPRTYPVCTIRSTPSAPIHCVVWAKTWLFGQLFGAKDEDGEADDAELERALAQGEGQADEIASLRHEANEMRRIRESLLRPKDGESDDDAQARLVFDKVFQHDVNRLLGMEDMWRNRRRPVPLAYDEARVAEEEGQSAASSSTSSLRDQQYLSLAQTAKLFQRSVVALARRAASNPEPISFDKDDDDALDFVTAAANLRSRIYHIAEQTRFQVKQMAGNIIPAIASTNAVTAGAQVVQLLHALEKNWAKARLMTLTRANGSRMLTSARLGPPNPECGVCQDVYVQARVDVQKCTLKDVLRVARLSRSASGLAYPDGSDDEEASGGIEVYEGTRLLADEDFDDNVDKPLVDLGLASGKTLTLVDEDGVRANVNLVLKGFESGSDGALIDVGPAEKLPVIKNRAVKKRKHEDSDDEESGIEEVTTPLPPKKAILKRAREENGNDEDDKEHSTKTNDIDTEAAPAVKKARTDADKSEMTAKSNGVGADASSAIELD